MATVIDSLIVSLGLDPTPLKKGLGQVAGIAMRFAAPIASVFSAQKMLSGFMRDVGEVSRMTGRYSQKLEEWRYKRAMLARVTREDIRLYKQCREAVVKFNIAMSDLTAKLARQFYPLIRRGLSILEKVTDWVKANEHNIVRFLTVVAGTITAVFLPALLRMSAALLMNPVTAVIAALGALILVIDDLVTYIRGGETAFGKFWAKFGTPEELKQKTQKYFEMFKKFCNDILPTVAKIGTALLGLLAVRGVFILLGKQFMWLLRLIAMFHPALRFLALVAVFIYQRWDQMVEGMKALIEDLASVWKNCVDWLADYFGKIDQGWQDLTTDVKSAWKNCVDWLADYFGKIDQGWQDLTTDVKSAWKKAVDWTADYIEKVVNGAKDLKGDLAKGFGSAVESAVNYISKLWADTKQGFSDLMDALMDLWKKSAIYHAFEFLIAKIKEAKALLGFSDEEEKKPEGAGMGALVGLGTGLIKGAKGVYNELETAVKTGGVIPEARPYNVWQQKQTETNVTSKQADSISVDNSINVTVQGDIEDAQGFADSLAQNYNHTADLADTGTYMR